MEHIEESADEVRTAGRRVGNDLRDGAGHVKSTASDEIKSLIADVEDLVARIADLKDADISRMRKKVVRAVDAAKESVVERADNLRRQAQQAVTTADDYVHDNPWQAVGIAAAVGALVGIIAIRRT